MTEWESVARPMNPFIGWGTTVGQYVEGKVLSYSQYGGKDANGSTCPEMEVELTLKAASFSKGNRTDFEPGTVVTVTCGLKSLKRDIEAANPAPGDLIRLELVKLVPTAKSPAKIIDVKIARGAGGPVEPRPQAQPAFTPPPQQEVFAGGFDNGGFEGEAPF